MKILYIDNKLYGHNSDLHIKFFQHMEKFKYHSIYGYGENMHLYFKESSKPNLDNVSKDFDKLLKKVNPDIIITYNCNGSSYEMGLDNVAQFKWITPSLAVTDLPKFHVTTDYCRSGFKKDQAQWFSDVGYTASFFRHKVALEYPISISAFWLPFSVDKSLYEKNILKNVSRKRMKVGFLGAAHNSSKSLYANRIAAFDMFNSKGLLNTTEIVNEEKQGRQMLFGDSYVKFLTKNLFGLTCGGTCNFMTAKYFQIPAAYSMLICTETSGLEMFPKDTYITYKLDEMDKLYAEVIWHINNISVTNSKIKKLSDYVIQNHNHDVRISSFTKRIKKLI